MASRQSIARDFDDWENLFALWPDAPSLWAGTVPLSGIGSMADDHERSAESFPSLRRALAIEVS
jgi:hypothetical protein